MATIIDLKIDDDGDFVVENGDLVIIEDQDVVAQSLRILFQTVQGEWYLDTTVGIDYLGVIFKKGVPRSAIEAHLRSKILEIEHVKNIERLTAEVDVTTRALTVTFSVTTDISEDEVEGTLQFP